MKAGRELDALVAEKVMGIAGPFGWSGPPRDNETAWVHKSSVLYPSCQEATQRYQEYVIAKYGALRGEVDEHDASLCYWKEDWGPLYVDDYSTCISDAWEVVERFRRGDKTGRMVACCVDLHITDAIEEGGDSSCRIYGPTCAEVEARAPEMPLAICLAALKAVGVEVPE